MRPNWNHHNNQQANKQCLLLASPYSLLLPNSIDISYPFKQSTMNSSCKKRKASEPSSRNNDAASTTTVAVKLEGNTPREIAASLLSLLPDHATAHQVNAKKLLRALDMVKSELTHRTNTTARQNEASGATQPFGFLDGQVELPLEAMHCVLQFLPHWELVHHVSLVNKAWLSATRSPFYGRPSTNQPASVPFPKRNANGT